ncbi:hypothetical protein OAL24_01302 [Oenococcus sicerae]|nr:hypothetical protein OAL24_01302 [Oenococcus sicerae]
MSMSLQWQARVLKKLAESKEENLVGTGLEPIFVSFTIIFPLRPLLIKILSSEPIFGWVFLLNA